MSVFVKRREEKVVRRENTVGRVEEKKIELIREMEKEREGGGEETSNSDY